MDIIISILLFALLAVLLIGCFLMLLYLILS